MGDYLNRINDATMKVVSNYSTGEECYKVFKREAIRHAQRLYNVNIIPLSELLVLPEGFYEKYFTLFLSSYFLDSLLDLKDENEWVKPSHLFAGMELQCDFENWILRDFPTHIYTLYKKFYYLQWEYQSLEKKWEMPKEYISRFNSYYQYYQKQIVLLFPLALLPFYEVQEGYSKAIYQAYQLYFSLLLSIDDYLDIQIDISNMSLTPVIAKFFISHGYLPNICTDVSKELELSRIEITELYNRLQNHCKENEIDFAVFEKQLCRFNSILNL